MTRLHVARVQLAVQPGQCAQERAFAAAVWSCDAQKRLKRGVTWPSRQGGVQRCRVPRGAARTNDSHLHRLLKRQVQPLKLHALAVVALAHAGALRPQSRLSSSPCGNKEGRRAPIAAAARVCRAPRAWAAARLAAHLAACAPLAWLRAEVSASTDGGERRCSCTHQQILSVALRAAAQGACAARGSCAVRARASAPPTRCKHALVKALLRRAHASKTAAAPAPRRHVVATKHVRATAAFAWWEVP